MCIFQEKRIVRQKWFQIHAGPPPKHTHGDGPMIVTGRVNCHNVEQAVLNVIFCTPIGPMGKIGSKSWKKTRRPNHLAKMSKKFDNPNTLLDESKIGDNEYVTLYQCTVKIKNGIDLIVADLLTSDPYCEVIVAGMTRTTRIIGKLQF
jgi:hypothetical protein